MEQLELLEPANICTYWPNNPAFDPKTVLLCRLFFINEDRTYYVSVGFYPTHDYLPLVEFEVVQRGGGPKTLILSDEQVDAMAEVQPMLRDAMCSVETSVGVAVATVVLFRWIGPAVGVRLVYTSNRRSFP